MELVLHFYTSSLKTFLFIIHLVFDLFRMRCDVYSILELIKKFTDDLTIDKRRVFEVCKYNEVARHDAHIQNTIVLSFFLVHIEMKGIETKKIHNIHICLETIKLFLYSQPHTIEKAYKIAGFRFGY